MLEHAKNSDEDEFIVATEMGLLYRLRNDNPTKKFYSVSDRALCPIMKKIDLDKVDYVVISPGIPPANHVLQKLASSGCKFITDIEIIQNLSHSKFICITGTNGKTSTVEFCRQLWALSGWKAASMGTLGTKTETAVNKSLYKNQEENLTTFEPSDLYKKLNFLVEEKISHLALEASSHGIDQYRLDGVNFSGAVFTNLSHDHLDYHGNTSNYFSAKKRLFTAIPRLEN